MTRYLLPLLAALLLTAQSCEPPKQGGTDYCQGDDYTIAEQILDGLTAQPLIHNTIIGGTESTDRRATVKVLFGQSYCSGVVLSPHTVLTAGHCGYGASTTHRIRIEGDSKDYLSTEKLVHPDYLEYVRNPADLEARKADLMLLYTEEELPGPYVGNWYTSLLADQCLGLVAQGYGKADEGLPSGVLREAKYLVTLETEKLLVSRLAPGPGRICYGDSGGPLYADVGGNSYLAGITTTTMSQDCLVGGSHVKVSRWVSWIMSGTRP